MLAGLACAFVLVLGGNARAEEVIAVIANRDDGLREISLTRLRRIYLGTITEVGGQRVHRYDLRAGSPARAAVRDAVLQMPEPHLRNYWIEQALTGGRLPPREFATAESLIEAVAERAGAIGYVPLAALDAAARSRVRILRLTNGSSSWGVGDPGYPIRAP